MYLKPSHKRISVLYGPRLKKSLTFFAYWNSIILFYRGRMLALFRSSMCWRRTRILRRVLALPQALLGPPQIKGLSSGGIHVWISNICLRNSSPWVLDIIGHIAEWIPGSICQAESHQIHCSQYFKCLLGNIVMENCLKDKKYGHSSGYFIIYPWNEPSQ